MKLASILMAAVAVASPVAIARADVTTSNDVRAQQVGRGGVPRQLSADDAFNYRAVFAAIRARSWNDAAARLDAAPGGMLTPIARAELILAKGSPRANLNVLTALIAQSPDLPEAAELARLARSRGAASLTSLPVERDLVRMPGATRRMGARTTRSDTVAAAMGPKITALIKANQPAQAEAALAAQQVDLTSEARTEWQQRVAWSYYLTGDDASALRLANIARVGAGEWAVQADWVAGLAAWRSRDFAAAGDAFSSVARHARDSEMQAAGLFWAARADLACQHPERVQAKLRAAARQGETFYGLLAAGSLGIAAPSSDSLPELIGTDWQGVAARHNVRVAAALTEIGEDSLADEVLRHQARIGPDGDHGALLNLAGRLELPSTQIWLAQHGPAGMNMPVAARYPAPAWTPQGGWRVDRSLVFAHALQESQFRTDATSRVGARGLMQLMPGTAQMIARRRGETLDRAQLDLPAISFEYGQSYLEDLRDAPGTQGLLPKVIAAYNCGPNSVLAWNARGIDRGDPLLFIESIPYAETRAYVAIVLRNYWMYQKQSGQSMASLKAIAQGMWPRFPGMPGKTAIRMETMIGSTASADKATAIAAGMSTIAN